MIGKWFIDGIDIYDVYGVGIEKGGYNDLFKVPSLKAPISNDWHEQDGEEVDLEDPKLDNKSVSIGFAAARRDHTNNFIAMLTEPGYRVLSIPSLRKTWNLRISSEENSNMWRSGQRHSFLFYDDNPRRFITDILPAGHGLRLPGSLYSLDGVRLDQYGIVSEETRAEVFKMPTLKQNLERSIDVIDSKLVSTLSANMSTRETTLKLCFYCSDIDTFWRNYSSFFYSLTKPGERYLYVSEIEEEIPCYYHSTSGFDFSRNGDQVILKFNLTLTFITYRIRETDYLLAAEDYSLIVLEDGKTYIDMEVN